MTQVDDDAPPAASVDRKVFAVAAALRGEAGLVGHDEERGDELRAIEFDRIKGGKPFDIATPWFSDLLDSIGQASAQLVASH